MHATEPTLTQVWPLCSWRLFGDDHLGADAQLSLPLCFALPIRNAPPVIPCKVDVEVLLDVNGRFGKYQRRSKKTDIGISLKVP